VAVATETGVVLSGQVAGRIDAIVPVADVIARTVREFHETVESLAKNYLRR
jgi:enoyl-[acyl-carrier protein] reductase II